MAAASSTQKALNPSAEEFKPSGNDKTVVPFVPQGNELVVYQPPPVLPFHGSQPQYHHLGWYYYYQQQNIPFYWIHKGVYLLDKTPQNQSFPDKGEIFSDGMKKNWMWVEKVKHQDQSFLDKDEIFSVGMKKNWKNKKPLLPPRLMRDTERGWKTKGFLMRKPHQETGSSISQCISPPPFFSRNKTTVMIRNIPNQFRSVICLSLLHKDQIFRHFEVVLQPC